MTTIAAAGPGSPLPLHRARSVAARTQELAALLWKAKSPLLFGVRLWASVCLALYVAFWLQLDNAYWAGTSAAIVCQPSLGASLRKASYRMVGTVVGAVLIVVLSAAFPQSRAPFLLGLALWGALCCFAATVLRNYASYAAALAGYTAAIIAADELGYTGGTNGQVFLLAVTRATEIWIGIICAGAVLALTDFGTARRRLTAQLSAVLAEAGGGFIRALTLPGAMQSATLAARRSLIRRVKALDPVIDEAIGESTEIRYRSGVLQDALDGLFAAAAGWSRIANHLEQLSGDKGREDAAAVLGCIPPELQSALAGGSANAWIAEASKLRAAAGTAVEALTALPASTPSPRLLADQAAVALRGLSHALNGVALLNDPTAAIRWSHHKKLRIPDLLPALVNALRAFLAIAAVSLFWIATAWPGGAFAITFAAIAVILLSPRGDFAPAAAISFLFGAILTSVLAAILKFALLPQFQTFTGLSIALGLVLVPLGALLAQPWQAGVFLAAAYNFIPLLSPTNQMTYDTAQYYNSALAIILGMGAAALAMVLLPQLAPGLRARRLLALTLRDFRKLAVKPIIPAVNHWVGHVSSRLEALPDEAKPIQFARVGTALSAGAQIIRLRYLAFRFGFGAELDPAFEAIAHGHSQIAIKLLAKADATLSQPGNNAAGTDISMKARAGILLLSEALSRHGAYFDGTALE
jgi:uncharacterized membrane protein YccC